MHSIINGIIYFVRIKKEKKKVAIKYYKIV